jgi:adenylosuccinate synthase
VKKASIIVGLGFGDEGKGLVSDYLCSILNKPIVIRFSGGHQSGHTVVPEKGKCHIFSSFGSGTLRGIPTYWSQYCAFSPEDFLLELSELKIGVKFFLNKKCPVTTHYDILFNRAMEATLGDKRIGSSGSGFSATVDRHHERKIFFHAADLFDQNIVKEKLQEIRLYYKSRVDQETEYCFEQFDHDSEDMKFTKNVSQLKILMQKNDFALADEKEILCEKSEWQNYIFEGSQGILLDMEHGTKPHITRSNTTSKNAVEMLSRNRNHLKVETNVFYVTRAYQTRHGIGPFKVYEPNIQLKNLENESNLYNEYQGEFRVTYLNIDLLNYSLACDSLYSKDATKYLVVTCLDQITSPKLEIYKNDEKLRIDHHELGDYLHFEFANCYFSFSACSTDLTSHVQKPS